MSDAAAAGLKSRERSLGLGDADASPVCAVSDAAAAETADGGSERRKRTWVNCGAVCVALHVSVVLIREYE